MKKILITGADGFLGKILCQKLKILGQDFVAFRGDITDNKNVENNFETNKFDVILHLAAVRNGGRECLMANGLGTLNILEQAKKQNCRLVFISSMEVYGRQKIFSIFSEESAVGPDSFYGITKLLGEKYCQLYSENFGVSCISLRLAPVFGINQIPNSTTSIFIERAKQNEDIVIYGKGDGCLDLLFAEDAAEAIILAGNSKIKGVFNIGSDNIINIRQLAEEIKKIWNSKSKIVLDENKKENCYNIRLDIAKAKSSLGYFPKYNLAEGLLKIKEAGI